MTRNERKLIATAAKRKRLIERIAKAGNDHKATRALQGRLIDATVEQLKVERRLERKRA